MGGDRGRQTNIERGRRDRQTNIEREGEEIDRQIEREEIKGYQRYMETNLLLWQIAKMSIDAAMLQDDCKPAF